MTTKKFMSGKPASIDGVAPQACAPKSYTTYATPGTAASDSKTAAQVKPEVKTNDNSGIGGGRGLVNPPTVSPSTPNAYAHEPNSVSSSQSTTSSTNFDEKVKLKLDFRPNILDNFDAITYHLKLFITSPEVSSSGNIFDVENQVIIAETGITDLTIDNLEVKSITAPSVEAGTGTSTVIKFEIIEPSGANLIDNLFYQSLALGIGNWAVMPIYLQLQFRSRDPDSSAPNYSTNGELSSLKWLWPLKLSDIKANVTHAGTNYEFQAIYYNEFAQSNAVSTLTHSVTLSSIKTFGQAMTELQNKLNEEQLLKLFTSYSVPDTYKIVVDPKLAGEKIRMNKDNTDSMRNDGFSEFGDKSATFTHGVSIDKIVDTLLAHTEKYQKILHGSSVAGGNGKTANELPGQMKKLWRVITETRPLQFDPLRVMIANEYTFYIIEYDIGLLETISEQTSAPPITLEAQKKRLYTYANNQILKKKYNYLFTGLNDQILNFDVTINNAFAMSMARIGGIYTNTAMSDIGPVNHNHAEEEKRITEIISKTISFQNKSKNSDESARAKNLEETKKSIEASNLPDYQKARYITLLDKTKPESRLSYLEEVQNAGGIELDGQLAKSRLNATIISKPSTEKITNKQLNFISDIDYRSPEAISAHTRFIENSKGKLRPIARYENMQDRQIGMGLESSSNSGIQKLSSAFSVALHSGLDSSFQTLKMTIKGDPHWLSPQPYKDGEARLFNSRKPVDEAIEWIKNAHFRVADSVNIYGTDNFILIRFRTPRVFEGSNTEDVKDVETLSGVYKVTELTSKFSSGKFTQDITCIVDPEIRLADISDQIEEDASKRDTESTASQLTENTRSLPTTSIQGDRLSQPASATINEKIPKIRIPNGQ